MTPIVVDRLAGCDLISLASGGHDDADRDRLLKPLIVEALDTTSTRPVTVVRSHLVLDWLIRVQTPAWLNLRDDLKTHAVALQGLAPLADTTDRKSTRLNSSHIQKSRMPSSA